MSTEHSRWEALVDSEVIGEQLSDEEQSFVVRYEGEHPECGLERELWSGALDQLSQRSQVDEGEDVQKLGQRVLAEHRGVVETPTSTGSQWSWVAGLAGLAAAAGLAVWAWTGQPEETRTADRTGSKAGTETGSKTGPTKHARDPLPAIEPGDPVDPVGRWTLVGGTPHDGEPQLGGRVRPGEVIAVAEGGRGCVMWQEPTAVLCFEGELRLADDLAPGERRVHLESGRVLASLDPLGPGQRFTVDSAHGSVTAVGTVFAVEIEGGQVWASVLEGRVELRDPTLRELGVRQRSSLRGEVPTTIDGELPEWVQSSADLAELWRAADSIGQATVVVADGQLSGIHVDGHQLGSGPMRVLLPEGEHQLEQISAETSESIESIETIELSAGESLDLTPSAVGTTPKSARVGIPSAQELAADAQRNRIAKNFGETARLYRLLLKHHPNSPEATNVPVRLGDVLRASGEHKGAIEAYERYLERGGVLATEAEYGKILSLRALGRSSAERSAIQAYLAAHSRDYRQAELAARLAEL